MKERLFSRTKIIISIMIIMVVIFICYIIYTSSIIVGLNGNSDDMKVKIDKYLTLKEVSEGDIVDRKGQVLSKSKKPGETGKLVFPKQYSWLLGYIGKTTFNDANFTKEKKLIENYYALKGKYIDYLYKPGEKKGATLKLAIDNDVQMRAYSLIKEKCASVVVLEFKTGEIRCLANAQPEEYDVNDNSYKQWKKISKIDGFLIPNYLNPKEPGSVFKALTAAAMIQNKKEDLKYPIKHVQKIANHDVKNVSSKSWASMNLEQALGYSSNTYFGQAALEIGGYNLDKLAKKYKLGKKLELDFADVRSVFDLKGYDDDVVVDTAYGQGNTLITPLNLAIIYQSIANEGRVVLPHVIKDILYKGESIGPDREIMEYNPIKVRTANKLKKMLRKNVTFYYGKNNVVDNLHAKTGTAQITGSYKYRKTIASFDNKYVVIITEDSDSGYGINLWDDLIDIYKCLY